MMKRSLKIAFWGLALTCVAFLPMGCLKVPPAKLACAASAPSIYPGQPQTITATPSNLLKKKGWNTVYEWSGPNVTGSGATATVDTSALAPGDYTVKGTIKQGAKGQEGKTGRKKNWGNEVATCEAPFTVKQFEPPTVSCVADPMSVKPGESSTVTATGVSPQNLPLTYTFSSSEGSINGSGNTATLTTTGAPSGPITVTCNVQDNKGQTASSTTTVDVEAPPPPPPAPQAEKLCTITFNRDKYRPVRVDNVAKACLDDVALNAQRQPDATLVLVGNSVPGERDGATRAAERAVNAKQYLVKDKGIDASRVEVRTGNSGSKEVEDYLVPAGANFENDVPGTEPVNESELHPHHVYHHPVHHKKMTHKKKM